MARLVCVLVVVGAVAGGPVGPATAAEEPIVVYAPPVDGPVVDRFRPPPTPYAAGNRGIDYETVPGEPVRSAAAGEVVFAGPVGSTRHVVVLHADGIRTSYSFLAAVGVRRGDRVEAGQPVGAAAARLHLGARAGDRYVDPEALLGGGVPKVHLVPVDLAAGGSAASERAWLARALGAAVRAGGQVAGWGADGATWAAGAAGAGVQASAGAAVATGWTAWRRGRALAGQRWAQLRLLGAYAGQVVRVGAHLRELRARAQLFQASQAGCTAPTRPVPSPPPGRRIAVLVAGFGSVGGDASILAVDTARLGYRRGDVAQLSYRGGRVPGVGALTGVPERDYVAADSSGDIQVAASHLRDLLAAIRAAHPGVGVDIIAHSQGGLVARAALGEAADGIDPRLPEVANLITLGTPHRGADLATANALLGTTSVGRLVHGAVGWSTGGAVRGASPAAGQLAETSAFVARLQRRPLPAGARVTSIAAVGDLVVPPLASAVPGATNVLVPVDGIGAHAALPGTTAAHRELALALAGLPPTCRDLGAGLARAAATSLAEDLVGGAAGTAAVLLDRRPAG